MDTLITISVQASKTLSIHFKTKILQKFRQQNDVKMFDSKNLTLSNFQSMKCINGKMHAFSHTHKIKLIAINANCSVIKNAREKNGLIGW